MIKKIWIFRFSLMLISLTLSLLFVELGLRALGYSIQIGREASFNSSKDSREDFFKLKPFIKSEKWVVTLGDSLTNGGNVSIDKSYPFQLYHKSENSLGKNHVKYNILNYGKCESNTYQSLLQIKELLEDFKEKPDYLVFLGGAADRFSPIANFEQTELNQIKNEIRQSTTSRFIKSLRLFKIYRSIKIALRNKFYERSWETTEESFLQKNPLYKDILKSITLGDYKKADEQIASLGPIVTDFDLETFINLGVDELNKSLNREEVIPLTLHFIEKYPSLYKVHAKYPFHRLVIAYDYQSKYSSEYISKRIEAMAKANPWIIETLIYSNYYKLFKEKERTTLEIRKTRMTNLRSIAKLCKEHGIKLIIQNYPADFREANIALEQLATEFNLPFIDNHSEFNELISKNSNRHTYLEDDEHGTPLGYSIMADNVWAALEAN